IKPAQRTHRHVRQMDIPEPAMADTADIVAIVIDTGAVGQRPKRLSRDRLDLDRGTVSAARPRANTEPGLATDPVIQQPSEIGIAIKPLAVDREQIIPRLDLAADRRRRKRHDSGDAKLAVALVGSRVETQTKAPRYRLAMPVTAH